MVTSPEVLRERLNNLDAAALAYANACVAYEQAGDDAAAQREAVNTMHTAHKVLMARAGAVAGLL